jgi:uncharacterized protein (TIGR02246 family)
MRRPAVRRILLPVLFLLVVAALGGCGAPEKAKPAETGPITRAVDSLVSSYDRAVAARDTGAVVDLYTDDVRFLPPGALRVEGKEGLRSAMVSVLSTPGLQLTTRSDEKLVSENGDMVVDLGSYDWESKTPSGKPVHDVGKYVRVYKKVNGEWKVLVETYNSDGPAGTTAPKK